MERKNGNQDEDLLILGGLAFFFLIQQSNKTKLALAAQQTAALQAQSAVAVNAANQSTAQTAAIANGITGALNSDAFTSALDDAFGG